MRRPLPCFPGELDYAFGVAPEDADPTDVAAIKSDVHDEHVAALMAQGDSHPRAWNSRRHGPDVPFRPGGTVEWSDQFGPNHDEGAPCD